MALDPAVAEVRAAVRTALGLTEPGAPVTVACSGGADSIALAAAVAFEAARVGIDAGAVTVDHGLQPGSDDRAATVAAVLRGIGLDPVTVATVVVDGPGGPEAAARRARYAALESTQSERGGWVALGHTLDDQAETVLIGLGRGSGPRSLAGMSAARFPWLRPLLPVRRATTRAACVAEGLPVWDDPHNSDPAYTRVRVRHELLPLMDDVLNGGVAAALARTADLLREDCDALDVIVADLAVDGLRDAAPDVDVFAGLHPAVRRRLLRLWLAGVVGLTAAHLGAVDALLVDWHGQGEVALPGGWEVYRASGRLHLQAGS
ncbi:MAG: tRNA lysidine(34) synthetase TilS [Geodermatophilaceae bacterium]